MCKELQVNSALSRRETLYWLVTKPHNMEVNSTSISGAAGGLGAPAGAAAGALLGHAVGKLTAAEATTEAGKVETVTLPAPGDDAAAVGGEPLAGNVQSPGLPGVQETRES
jgi:hypothetical protein